WDIDKEDYQKVRQVWFCGMHTDVGGGYKEQKLSDIALQWMIDNSVKQGLRIYQGHNMTINPDANGPMHDSRGSWLTRLFRRKVRSWNTETHGKPVVHSSVLERTLNRHNDPHPPYRPWILDMEYEIDNRSDGSNHPDTTSGLRTVRH
ncbi:MAG: DUF2235 domain-containing protein, partial [Bacteroidetes bacterium]|nr:DUF2235 domain-containing protein [Bacteroidota bacterium]